MAWTTPRTWTAGETVTASLMNTHLRDNLNYAKSIIDVAAQGFHSSATSVSNTSTSENVLYSKTLSGSTIDANGKGLAVRVCGFNGATTNSKVLSFYVGGNSINLHTMTGSGNAFVIDYTLIRSSSSGLRYWGVRNDGTVALAGNAILSVSDFTADNVVKLTATCPAASDITVNQYIVTTLPYPSS